VNNFLCVPSLVISNYFSNSWIYLLKAQQTDDAYLRPVGSHLYPCSAIRWSRRMVRAGIYPWAELKRKATFGYPIFFCGWTFQGLVPPSCRFALLQFTSLIVFDSLENPGQPFIKGSHCSSIPWRRRLLSMEDWHRLLDKQDERRKHRKGFAFKTQSKDLSCLFIDEMRTRTFYIGKSMGFYIPESCRHFIFLTVIVGSIWRRCERCKGTAELYHCTLSCGYC